MRKLFFLISLLCPMLTLSAASWSPSAEIAVHYDGTAYSAAIDSERTLRSSVSASIRVDAAALSFGSHRISLPVKAAMIAEGCPAGRTKIQARAVTTISLEYCHAFSSLFALSASADASYICYLGSRAASWGAGATLTPLISAGAIVSIAIPLSITYGKGMLGFSAGVGMRIGGRP